MNKLLLIFIGGGLGSVTRYLVGTWLHYSPYYMPYGTFAVNLTGSLLIGAVAGFTARPAYHHPFLMYFFIAGFFGGFTTFSSFSYETLNMIKQGNWTLALVYVSTSIILGVMAAALGFYASKTFL